MSRLVIEVAAAALIGLASCLYGVHVEAKRLGVIHAAELDRINAASHEAARIASDELRAHEQRHVKMMADLDAHYTKELQSEINSKERAVADLHADVIRVRDEFACSGAAAKGGASKPGTSTGMGDAASAGGLQSTHVEFLLREAGRADEAVMQLQACQAIVQQDRGQ